MIAGEKIIQSGSLLITSALCQSPLVTQIITAHAFWPMRNNNKGTREGPIRVIPQRVLSKKVIILEVENIQVHNISQNEKKWFFKKFEFTLNNRNS